VIGAGDALSVAFRSTIKPTTVAGKPTTVAGDRSLR
jgi:hypothetical protein